VQIGDLEVKVLGTSFNISAYKDDKEITVVLLEGKVGVYAQERSHIMKPGDKIEYNKITHQIKTTQVHPTDYIEWTKEDIIKPENLVAKKPTLMNDNPMHYCPGCSHGVVHKLVAEVIEEMGLEDKAIGISPVGCAVFIYNYIDIDWQEAAHGRAPALATAIKRLWPDRLVFTYQGDGDLACIGTAETIHALNRGENITIIFINNAIYGMTGGQMAPTTLVGMKTSTSPYGRDVHLHGYPLKMADIAAQLEGTAYVTRQSVQSVPAIRKAKKAIRKAFENSMAGKGSNLVEIVSTCNSGWKMSPAKSNEWMVENMFPFYPLGDLKDK
jgi:2-oxoglutarate ferredoxin oxidoreductase subunit beta